EVAGAEEHDVCPARREDRLDLFHPSACLDHWYQQRLLVCMNDMGAEFDVTEARVAQPKHHASLTRGWISHPSDKITKLVGRLNVRHLDARCPIVQIALDGRAFKVGQL